MDAAFSLFLFLGSFLLAYFIYKRSTRQDQRALDEEIDRDFTEEFGLGGTQKRDLSPESMEKVVDWLEDDLKEDRPNPTPRGIEEPEDIV